LESARAFNPHPETGHMAKKILLQPVTNIKGMTPEHLAIVHEISLHPELTYQQIAGLVGVSRNTVVRVAKEAHITRARGRKHGLSSLISRQSA
jgi:hypothetical protein